ncbi:MAG TPA: deoxyribonuclease IV [Bacillota bacterium]|nr:deoxyribonuclease IV [Bacillota bacterium]
MNFGSHVSIRNGYLGAAKYALQIGAACFQYFPKNPRSLNVKQWSEKDASSCAQFCKDHRLVSISHAPYPTNVSEADKEMRQVILQSLKNDLEITDACGSIGLVVHFGKYKGSDSIEGYKLMIDMLNQLLLNWQGKALVLIENNAGQGVRMGTTFEELVQIRKLCDKSEQIGFCLDTCHAFASGLWGGENWSSIAIKGEKLGYFENLKAVHLNDSAYPYESYRDRHANIGRGFIGEVNMREFLQSHSIQGIPKILETPTTSDYTHKEEIEYVNQMVLKNALE